MSLPSLIPPAARLSPPFSSQVANRGLCAVAQAESMRYKLLGGLAVRRACYGVLRFVMESGAWRGAALPCAGRRRCRGGAAGALQPRAGVSARAASRSASPVALPGPAPSRLTSLPPSLAAPPPPLQAPRAAR